MHRAAELSIAGGGALAALAVGLLVAAGELGASPPVGDAPGSSTVAERSAAARPGRPYPVNAAGLTVGRPVPAADPWPDLVQVVATNQRLGYVYRTDLLPSPHAHPKAARDPRAGARARTAPVFTVDGTTVIGQYVIDHGADS